MDQEFKRLTAVVLPYSFLCSVFGNYCFWGFVDINPFDFISLDDILTQSVPIFVLSGFSLVPVLFLESLLPRKNKFPADGDSKMQIVKLITVICAILVFTALTLAASKFYKYPVVYAGLFSGLIPLAVMLSNSPKIAIYFSSRLSALAALLVIICLPVAMIWASAEKASRALIGTNVTYIEASNLKDLGTLPSTQKLIYYGKLGNFLFFKVNDSVIGFPIESFKQISFKRYAEKP